MSVSGLATFVIAAAHTPNATCAHKQAALLCVQQLYLKKRPSHRQCMADSLHSHSHSKHRRPPRTACTAAHVAHWLTPRDLETRTRALADVARRSARGGGHAEQVGGEEVARLMCKNGVARLQREGDRLEHEAAEHQPIDERAKQDRARAEAHQ